MVDKTAAGSQQTDQRDADTRDSLAALARRRSNSSPIVLQSDVQAAPQEKQEKQEKQSEAGSALQTGEDANDDANRAEESQTVKEKDAADGPDNTQQPQMASISAITTQVLPPSFSDRNRSYSSCNGRFSRNSVRFADGTGAAQAIHPLVGRGVVA